MDNIVKIKSPEERYYTALGPVDAVFHSLWKTGWSVFDRELIFEDGSALPICFCIGMTMAAKITKALNDLNERERLCP